MDVDRLVAAIRQEIAADEQWALAASQPYRYAADGATVPPGGVHWTWVTGDNWTPTTVDPVVDDCVGGAENYGCSVNLASVEQWPTDASDHGWPVRTMPRVVANQMVEVDTSAGGHIVRHDPARVLRMVTAHRKIVDALEEQQRRADENGERFVRAMRAPAENAEDLSSIKTHGWELAGRLDALRHIVDLLAELYGIQGQHRRTGGRS